MKGREIGRRARARRVRLLSTLCLLAVAPAAAVAGVHVQYLGRAEGLPSSQVHAVAAAQDGFVWIAGPAGLSHYDGISVRTYGRTEGLSSQGLRSLAVDIDNRLWVGTDVGVDVGQPDGALRALHEPERWTWGFVEAIAPAAGGVTWIGTARGLLRWSDADGLVPVEELGHKLVSSLAVDAAGHVWAAAPGRGLFHFDGSGWRRLELPSVRSIAPLQVVIPARAGGVYVGGRRGLLHVAGGGRRASRIAPSTQLRHVTALAEARDGLWVGSEGRLRRLVHAADGWRAEASVVEAGLVNQVVVDAQDNLWVATDNRGVAKISALRRAVEPLPLPCETQVYAVRADGPRGFLVAGDACSWSMADEHGGDSRRLAGLDRIKVWDLLRGRGGRIWAATEAGLYREGADGKLRPLSPSSDALTAPGRVLLEREGELYVGTVKGLVVLAGQKVREIATRSGAPLGYVYTLELDREGRLWVGTIGNGLWRESGDGRLARVVLEPLDRRGNVYAVAVDDPSGRVVVAQDDRLVVLDGGAAWTLPPVTRDAVAAWSVLFAPQDRLWVGSASGLLLYDLERREATQRLLSSMGLAGDEFTTSRSLLRAPGGALLCGVDRGLTRVDPAALAGFDEPPRARLRQVRWQRARLHDGPGPVRVDHGRWVLDVHVAAPWFLDERSLLYRHRLDGFDTEWSDPRPGAEQAIHYTALAEGDYALDVQAYSPLVGWGPVTRPLTFRVLPPWWRTPWAIAFALAAAVGLVLATGRWRQRTLIRRAAELELLIEARTRELREAHDRLQHLATYDELTGLPNQRTFWRRAREMETFVRRHGGSFALVIADLDRFKAINDTYGHRLGDAVLAFVAGRLRQMVRESDLLARYGGEEFVVLMHTPTEDAALQATERMRLHLAGGPFTDGTVTLPLSASFGVSLWRGDADSLESLFRRADRALYEAKGPRNAVVVRREEPEPATT